MLKNGNFAPKGVYKNTVIQPDVRMALVIYPCWICLVQYNLLIDLESNMTDVYAVGMLLKAGRHCLLVRST